MGCLFKLAGFILSGLFFLAIAAVAVGGFLIFSGTPKACVDRNSQPAPQASQALQANWADLLQRVAQGETVPLSIDEDEASAIGQSYLDAKNVPLDDLRVYFCPDGTAEATGKAGIFGLDSNIRIKGRLSVEDRQPRIEIDSVQVGSFPNFLARRLTDVLIDDEDARTLPLVANITAIEYHDGEALVTIAP